MFKRLIEKILCMHDYETIEEVEYDDRIVLILKCKNAAS